MAPHILTPGDVGSDSGGNDHLPVAPPALNSSQHISETVVDQDSRYKNEFYYAIIYFYLAVLVFSVLLNLLFVFVVVTGWRTFNKKPFIRIVWQLIIANLMQCLSAFVCGVPLIYLQDGGAVYVKTVVYQVFTIVASVADLLLLMFTLLVAIHRVVIFLFPHSLTKFFDGRSLIGIITFFWILCLASALSTSMNKCVYTYHELIRAYLFGCAGNTSTFVLNFVRIEFIIQDFAIPVLILLCYLSVLIKIFTQRVAGTSRAEKDILLQGILVFLAFEIISLTTVLIFNSKMEPAVAFLTKRILSTTPLIAGSLTPLFFLLLNRDLKYHLKYMLTPSLRSTTESFSLPGKRTKSVSGTTSSSK